MIHLLQFIESGNKEKVEEIIAKNDIPIDSTWTDYALLRSAVRKGHVDITKRLIEQGCRVNKSGRSALNTLLHIAVKDERKEMVKLLLENGAAVETKNGAGETPLTLAVRTYNETIMDLILQRSNLEKFHVACIRNRLNTIDGLLRSGVSVNTRIASNSLSWPNYTPLLLTMAIENYAVVERLLDNGADVNVKNPEGITALHIAVRQDVLWIMQKLLDCGADLHAKNPEGMTALHMAFQANNQPIIDCILKVIGGSSQNDNVTDDRGFSYFHIACIKSNPSIVESFLKSGIEFNGKVSDDSDIWPGYTPLHLAVEHYNIEIVKLLLEHGADINLKNKNGQTPLHIAATDNNRPINMRIKIIDLIASISQNNSSKFLNQIDQHGFSHFHAVCMSNNWKVVLEFLKQGEDINQSVKADAPKWPSYTPLHFALEFQCEETAKVLLRRGANIRKTSDEYPLIKAVKNMGKAVVGMLLDMGADVNYCMEHLSPLHYAVLFRGPDIVELLIKRKAKVNGVEKNSRWTPLHYAVRNAASKVVQILLKEGADVNARTADGKTALHLLVDNDIWSSKIDMNLVDVYNNIIMSIVDAGGDINAPDRQGWTPLFQASIHVHASAFYALLINGAEMHVGSCNSRGSEVITSPELRRIYDTHQLKMHALSFSIDIYKNSIRKDIRRMKLKDLSPKCIEQFNNLSSKHTLYSTRFDENEFSESCMTELNLMQYIEIDDHTSLYSIIFANPIAMGSRAFSASLKKTLKLKYFDKVFPLYGFLIRQQFRKSMSMSTHVNSGKRALETLSRLGLPDPCTEAIIKNLNEKDLKNLIRAAEKKLR